MRQDLQLKCLLGFAKKKVFVKIAIKVLVRIYNSSVYDSIATVGEIQVWWRADFQSGSRVLKKLL